MISEEIYNELKNNNRSSFALWSDVESSAPKKVCNIDFFEDYNGIAKRIKPNIIFVGMNLAGDAPEKMKPFSNFHSENIVHNDYRLRDAIVGTPFEGAYMTDLFHLVTSSSSELARYYKSHPVEREIAVKEFVDECRKICADEKYIICIGTGYHYKVICDELSAYPDFVCRYNDCEDNKPCFYIPHYSGAAGNTNVSYNEKAKKQLCRIADIKKQ